MEAVTSGVEYNRERALHYCVLECASLWTEWSAFADSFSDRECWNGEKFRKHINDFIKQKSIRIASETPSLRIINGKYVVENEYIFEW